MSPRSNDPTTAVAALSRASTLLDRLIASEPFENSVIDDDGCGLQVDQPSLQQLIEMSVLQPITYSAGDIVVVRHLARQLGELGRQVDGDTRRTCEEMLDLLIDHADEKLPACLRSQLPAMHEETLGAMRHEPRLPTHRVA